MGVRSPEGGGEEGWIWQGPAVEPSRVAALTVALVLTLLLLSNGRPIPAGDTRVNDHVAASLVQERDFDLDEYPEIEPPWVRESRERHVSIYPVLSSLVATPVFAVARLVFTLDEGGCALAGKVAASLLSGLAAAALFVAVARRRDDRAGFWTALVFALGTTVWSTSQALWQHPAAVLGIATGLLFLSRAGEDPRWAGRAGLPLAFAFAARHADIAIVGVLALATMARWPKRIPFFAAWAAAPLAFLAWYNAAYFGSPWRQGFGDAATRFDAPWGLGHAGLLVSPAKGLLLFSPIVFVGLIGLVRAWREGRRFLAAACALAAVAHWGLMGRWGEWHGGESWGPRLMTDALPLLLLFLPEGMDTARLGGVLLGFLSVAIQALGAFSYDLRWERLYQRPAAAETAGDDAPVADAREGSRQRAEAALWRIDDSPIAFHFRERVLLLTLPDVADGKVVLRQHPIVPGGEVGSRLRFAGGELRIEATPATFGDVFLQKGARLEGDVAQLRGHWAGIFLRVLPEARLGQQVLKVEGRGRGTLYVGERSFWSTSTRWATYPIAISHRYFYPESGGSDLVITIGRAAGEADVRAIALTPPSGHGLTVLPSPAAPRSTPARPSPR
jgi:hypothetical protein